MTTTQTADTPLSPAAADTLVRLGMAGHTGLPSAKLRAADLGVLVSRGLASVWIGRATITQSGADLLADCRQPDGTFQIGAFRVGPMRAPAVAAN